MITILSKTVVALAGCVNTDEGSCKSGTKS